LRIRLFLLFLSVIALCYGFSKNNIVCDDCSLINDLFKYQKDLASIYSQAGGIEKLSKEKQVVFWQNELNGAQKNNDFRLMGLVHLKLGVLAKDPAEKLTHLTQLSIYHNTTMSEKALDEMFSLIEKDPKLVLSLDYFFNEIKLIQDYPLRFSKKLFKAYIKLGNMNAAGLFLKQLESWRGKVPWLDLAELEILLKEKKEREEKV